MISLITLYEHTVPDNISDERSLVKWAKSKKIIPRDISSAQPQLKDGEFCVALKQKTKNRIINPKTGRLKNKKITRWLITNIKPEDRSFKNLPKDSKKKSKVRFQDWLNLKTVSHPGATIGYSPNGSWYGWSHRAAAGFNIGKKIKPGTIGNKYRKKSTSLDKKETFAPYVIKTDEEAKEHAIRFSKEVS